MDIPDIGPGSIIYLPVYSPGARLFIGDAHACQGDGELCGNGVEIASETTIHVDLIKDWQISWPRLENEELIMAIGSARPLEDAQESPIENWSCGWKGSMDLSAGTPI